MSDIDRFQKMAVAWRYGILMNMNNTVVVLF